MSSSCLHYHFETIGSTNTWAKENLDRMDPKGVTLISASEQTMGRGRFKRQWLSPIHQNIYASFCFHLDINRVDFGHLPQLLALSAIQILENFGFSPTLKWPNDILIQEKKLGGLLCETIMTEQKRWIINGIGLNVNMPSHLLNKIDRPSTSLFQESGQIYDINTLLKQLDQQFTSNLSHFMKEGFDTFFPSFKCRSTFKKGQQIRFHNNQEIIEGTFEELYSDGSVQIKLLSGISKRFYAGEFIF
jgi:BirA family biotin operon repressor/biotin-[acetyl-CoA-carboxylase] ligase